MTTIGANTSQVTLISANPARKQLTVFNQSASILYASTLNGFSKGNAPFTINPQSSVVFSIRYTGPLYGVWDAAIGQAQVTEV
jgi:hypothetical protein